MGTGLWRCVGVSCGVLRSGGSVVRRWIAKASKRDSGIGVAAAAVTHFVVTSPLKLFSQYSSAPPLSGPRN